MYKCGRGLEHRSIARFEHFEFRARSPKGHALPLFAVWKLKLNPFGVVSRIF
jgi:hypothetical protein